MTVIQIQEGILVTFTHHDLQLYIYFEGSLHCIVMR